MSDSVGNLKTMWEGGNFPKTFAFDAADRLVTMSEGANLTTYAWTGYGALASEITGTATTACAYNGQDQLVGVTPPTGFPSTYSFDGNGLRRTAQEGNALPTTMVWDGSDYLLLRGPTSDQVVLSLDSEIVSCGSKDLLTDPLGTLVKEITAGAHLSGLFQFHPYGALAGPNPLTANPYRYGAAHGYYTDNTHRDYIRARELEKKLGRWMQLDPLWPGERGYEYGSSSPLQFADPEGTQGFGQDPLQQWGKGMDRYLHNKLRDELDELKKKCRELEHCYACLHQLYEKYGKIYRGGVGKGNALRHCVGACAARRQCGETCAGAILGHEVKFGTQDSKCNRFNNQQGFVVAESSLTCFQGCSRLWKARLLCPPPGGGGGAGSRGSS